MPRTPKAKGDCRFEPYASSDSSAVKRQAGDIEDDTKPNNTANAASDGRSNTHRPRPWTAEEYLLLFDHVVKGMRGKKIFENAVPGRNSNSIWLAWRDVLEPACRKAVEAKGKGKKREA